MSTRLSFKHVTNVILFHTENSVRAGVIIPVLPVRELKLRSKSLAPGRTSGR